jgi:hypothetical protein
MERTEHTAGTVRLSFDVPVPAVTVVQPPPDLLCQKNIEAVTGIGPSVYLEILRRPDFDVPVTKIGELRLVSRVAFLAWVDGLSDEAGVAPLPEPGLAANDAHPITAAGVLEEIRRESEAASKRRARSK